MNKWKKIKISEWGDIAYLCPYCDYLLYLNNRNPKEHDFYYCPKCGKQLIKEEQC